VYAYAFFATGGASLERDVPTGNAKGLRDETGEVIVGLAVHWRRGDANPEGCPVGASQFVPAGPGLHPEIENEVIAVPAIPAVATPRGRQMADTQPGAPVACISGGTTSISSR